MTTTTGRGLAVTSPKLIFTDSGKHCYAYSGTFPASTVSAEMFNFKTGNEAVKGEFTFNGQVRFIVGSAGGHSVFQISFNDIVVHVSKCDTSGNDSPVQTFQKVIIPPLTTVVVDCISGEDTATELITSTFRGKVV